VLSDFQRGLALLLALDAVDMFQYNYMNIINKFQNIFVTASAGAGCYPAFLLDKTS
jgi:hypothetical protein